MKGRYRVTQGLCPQCQGHNKTWNIYNPNGRLIHTTPQWTTAQTLADRWSRFPLTPD